MAKEKTEEKTERRQINEETAQKIQSLQILEQNLQNLVVQKQTFQFEISETINALGELNECKDEVYKIIGSIMLKSKKQDLEKDLLHKKDLLELRIKNIEKQEQVLKEKLLKIRNDVVKDLK